MKVIYYLLLYFRLLNLYIISLAAISSNIWQVSVLQHYWKSYDYM